MTHAMHHT